MKNHYLLLGLLTLSGMTACNTPPADVIITGDAEKGKLLFATCIPCHGEQAQGMLKTNAPTLAGQESWYLARQLNNFKTGIRGTDSADTYGKQMAAISLVLQNDQAIADVVAYIKTLPPATNEKNITGDIVKGRDYYNMACSSCHGNNASGNEKLNSPKLTVINDWYMERQLSNFKAGIRGKFPKDKLGAQMNYVLGTLKDEKALQDIIAYVNSLEAEPQAVK